MTCPTCGQSYSPVALAPGERAECARCGERLAHRSIWGEKAGLAFALSAAILAVPAACLPLVTLSRFGNERVSFLITSVNGLWRHDMPLLAVWVLFCGLVAPAVLLALLLFAVLNPEDGRPHPRIAQTAHRLQEWAMPEVFLLSVLVAFLKLGDLVQISIGPGLWCYGLMALCTLLAWRSFSLEGKIPSPSPDHAAKFSVVDR